MPFTYQPERHKSPKNYAAQVEFTEKNRTLLVTDIKPAIQGVEQILYSNGPKGYFTINAYQHQDLSEKIWHSIMACIEEHFPKKAKEFVLDKIITEY